MAEKAQPTPPTAQNNDRIIGEGVKFEHYQRACCRIVGEPETFPPALRAEVRDRVKHD